MKKILIFDTTLRDGSQRVGISFTVEDKVKIAKALDAFGVSYIEGGWPGTNPKDDLFFAQMKKIKLKNAKLTAFGSTRRKNSKTSEDKNLNAIIKSDVKTACIFGKSWDLHVKRVLQTTNEENIKMISESINYLKSKKLEVIFDAEHYFDGFKSNEKYALATIQSATKAGADIICLCETNGGMLPSDVEKIVKKTLAFFQKIKFGIHAHNDSGCAVANSITAIEKGCILIQGTINGIGERCGNANLCSIIPALELNKNCNCISKKNIKTLTQLSRYIDEIANLVPDDSSPYVGRNAFVHKAGMHVSAVGKKPETYEHIDPAFVGNVRKISISDLSGKTNVISKANEMAINIKNIAEKNVKKIIDIVKKKENNGYQYEGADASFFLIIKKTLGIFKPLFSLKGYRVSVEKDVNGNIISEATVKLDIKGKEEHTVAEGDGPVNALDNCLRKALIKYYPTIKDVFLRDFKVRVVDGDANTAAKVRVLIESSDSSKWWGAIGVSRNIIDASWQALSDSFEYKLIKDKKRR
ncbi:MAG: citramalate synthase [Endomicrobium sp.]|nr:citramalate synthase [Endomicrobium sp.]